MISQHFFVRRERKRGKKTKCGISRAPIAGGKLPNSRTLSSGINTFLIRFFCVSPSDLGQNAFDGEICFFSLSVFAPFSSNFLKGDPKGGKLMRRAKKKKKD